MTLYCEETVEVLPVPTLEEVALPWRLLAGLTASLSTAVQAMKDAQAARAKKMFWLEMPVSAQHTRKRILVSREHSL